MKYEFCEYYNKRQKLDNIIESIVLEANNNPEFLEILQEAGFFGNLMNAGKQMWQGIKGGAQAAYSQMTGPATQFQNSISALEKALAQIQKDPNWSKSATTGSPSIKSMPLMNWLQETIQELKNQQGQFANKQMAPPQTTAAQPAAGATYDPAATKFS
jgi:hypothetical protein